MNDTQEKEMAAREFRKAAYHEAGHMVMARRYGGQCEGFVCENDLARVADGEKAWRGQTVLYVPPGLCSYSGEVQQALDIVTPVPDNWMVLYGLAGFVAESIAYGVTDADEIFFQLEYAIANAELSETDMAAIGENWTGADVQMARDITTEDWHKVERIAGELMAFPRPPNG